MGTRNDAKTDYFINGKIAGLRTLKGDDMDYIDENDSRTNIAAVV
jgi:hypothetical protein